MKEGEPSFIPSFIFSDGASLCKGFHQGELEGGLLYWETRNMRFRDAKCPVNRSLSLSP